MKALRNLAIFQESIPTRPLFVTRHTGDLRMYYIMRSKVSLQLKLLLRSINKTKQSVIWRPQCI